MPWETDSAGETITEASAGAGVYMAAGVALTPRETIQFDFSRIDASPTEPWAVEVYASIDDTTYGSVPIATRRLDVTDLEANLIVTGPKYVKARVLNADLTPVDVVSVNITYSGDGVSI